MTLRLIINADDFGLSKPVNREIARLLRDGKITSTTILANGPDAEDALELLKDFGSACGMHLNFTEFKPLSKTVQIISFAAGRQFAGSNRTGVAVGDTGPILAEWDAQYRFLKDRNVEITHFDSHHHFHTHPACFPALRKFSRKTGISAMRNTANLYSVVSGARKYTSLKVMLKQIWTLGVKSAVSDVRMTDYFGSVTDFHRLIETGFDLNRLNGKTIELMCHPGHVDSDEFVSEIDMLEGRFWARPSTDIRLVDYRAFAAAARN